MDRYFLDRYAGKDTPVHRLDPRFKLVTLLALLVVVMNLKGPGALALAMAVLCLVLFTARIPVHYVFTRLLMALPFTGLLFLIPFTTPGRAALQLGPVSASYEGLSLALVLAMRLVVALLVVTALTSTTPFTDLLRAMAFMRVPAVFIQLVHFTVRYFFVLSEEITTMRRAQRSRGYAPGSVLRPANLVPLARLIGMAFIRAMERGERVYRAMRARNYREGLFRPPSRRAGAGEYAWTALTGLVICLLLLVDRGSPL